MRGFEHLFIMRGKRFSLPPLVEPPIRTPSSLRAVPVPAFLPLLVGVLLLCAVVPGGEAAAQDPDGGEPAEDVASGAAADAGSHAGDRGEGAGVPDSATASLSSQAEAGPPSGVAGDGEETMAPWLPVRVEALVRRAIRGGATPGAAVAVGHRGRIVLSHGYGRLDWAPGSPPVTDSTIYDLASLTKGVATATAAMQLVEQGRLDLDAPVHRYLAGWPEEGLRGRIRVRDLLAHRSGLPTGGALWRSARGRGGYLEALGRMPLEEYPGQTQRYSDYGMILLGLVVEEAGGATLDWQARDRIFGPLGMRETDFLPSGRAGVRHRIAPTGRLGGRHLRGEVHDPNARALGGVAGHAGLFSSARDLARFASALLWEEPGTLACRALVEGFTRDPDLSTGYALGWESASRWSRWGEHFSPVAFGHTGFTGTSIWIDPANELFVILLTNRVNSSARNRGHLDLRDRIHRAVRDALPRGGHGARRSAVWSDPGGRLGGLPVAVLRAEWEAREARERTDARRTVGDGVRAQSAEPCRPPPGPEELRRAVAQALQSALP